MRITIENWPRHFKTEPIVTLNGLNVRYVISADDSEGYVIVFKRGQDYELLVTEDGFPIQEKLHGEVRFVGERWPTKADAP